MSSTHDPIIDLLAKWQRLKDAGEVISPEELCRDCPELLPQLKARLARHAKVSQELTSSTVSNAAPREVKNNFLEPAHKIGQYQLVEKVGEGGFGEVWKAVDTSLDRIVALKRLRPDRKLDPEILKKEARLAAQLRHERIVAVQTLLVDQDRYCIIYDWIDGIDLHKAMQSKKISMKAAVRVVWEIAEALNYLHTKGMVHRDVKPSNILITSSGRAMLTDLGIAVTEEEILSDAYRSAGTTAYISPEVLGQDHLKTGPATDIYSLGIVLYELLTGRLPFRPTPKEDMIKQVLSRVPPSPRSINGEVPAALEQICLKAIQKSPADRYPSAKAMADDLHAYLRGPASEKTETTSAPVPAVPSGNRQRKWAVAAAAVIALGGGTGIFLQQRGSQTPPTLTPVAININPASPAAGASPASTPIPETSALSQFKPRDSQSQPAAASKPAPRPEDRVSLAVLRFQGHGDDPKVKAVGAGLSEMVTTDLSRISRLRLIERSRYSEVLKEHELAATQLIDPMRAVEIGRGISASFVMTGAYSHLESTLRIDTRVISVETGEITLAESVTGATTQFFDLEKSLVEKVLAVLKVDPTDSERRALRRKETSSFEAFEKFSKGIAASRQNPEEAAKALKEAVELDPEFKLAAESLARVHRSALIRLESVQAENLKKSGEIGARLHERLRKYQNTVEDTKYDGEYFCALLCLSAQMGLLGDEEREKKILIQYWDDLVAHVTPDDSLVLATEIQQALIPESEFFLKEVASDDVTDMMREGTALLKQALRDTLSWPNYSTIWPFSSELRHAMAMAERSPHLAKPEFEYGLKQLPPEYLESLIDAKHQRNSSEVLALCYGIIKYYEPIKNPPERLQGRLHRIERSFVWRLKSLVEDRKNVPPERLTAAIPQLELVSRVGQKEDTRLEAAKLLPEVTRLAQLSQGAKVSESTANSEPSKTSSGSSNHSDTSTTRSKIAGSPVASSKPSENLAATSKPSGNTVSSKPSGNPVASGVTIFKIPLAGPQIECLLQAEMNTSDSPSEFITEAYTSMVRSLNDKYQINCAVCGTIELTARRGGQASLVKYLFKTAEPATPQNQSIAINFLDRDYRSNKDRPSEMKAALADVLKRWPAGREGDLLLISYERNLKDTLQPLFNNRPVNCPRIHIVSPFAGQPLVKMTKATGGMVVRLEEPSLGNSHQWRATVLRPIQ